jgi:hypothetical protein
MEGNTSSACLILAEYDYIKEYIKKRMLMNSKPKFQSMFNKMLEKTKTYLQEALKCDAIILATAFNPAYWLSMIQAWFPQCFNYVKTLLQDKFNDRKLELEVAAKENLIQASLPLTRESGPNQTH